MMDIDEENIATPAAVNQAPQNPPDDLQDLMDVDATSNAIPNTTPDVRPNKMSQWMSLMVWLWDPFAVLLMVVLQNLKTIEVVYFVHTMNQDMVKDAICMTVQILKSVQHKHVKNINLNGEYMFMLIAIQIYLVSKECCKDLEKVCPGKLQPKVQVFKLMMKHYGQKEIDHIFLVLQSFIALKQPVNHVVL